MVSKQLLEKSYLLLTFPIHQLQANLNAAWTQRTPVIWKGAAKHKLSANKTLVSTIPANNDKSHLPSHLNQEAAVWKKHWKVLQVRNQWHEKSLQIHSVQTLCVQVTDFSNSKASALEAYIKTTCKRTFVEVKIYTALYNIYSQENYPNHQTLLQS